MIKKIVTLAVGFVFAFVAIFFSVRAEGVADGKGGGKDAAVADPEEFGTVLATLPDSGYYEGVLQEEMLKKAGITGKSIAASADENDFRPVTVYEKSLIKRQEHRSNSDSFGGQIQIKNDRDEYNYLRRTLYIYYTKDAVYYDSVGKMISKSKTEYGTYEKYARTTSKTTTDFDAHMYIGKGGAYIKFNKWDVTSETVTGTVINDKFTEDEKNGSDGEADTQKLVQEEVAKALKKHYGKWISISGGELDEMPDLDDIGSGDMPDFDITDFDPDNMSPSQMAQYQEQMISYLAKKACAEIADMYYEQLISTNEANSDSFAKFANYLKAYDQPLAYEQSGNIYKMTDVAKAQLLAEFGWAGLNSGSSVQTPDVGSSYFVIDMNDKKAPAFFANIDYNYSGNSGYTAYTLRDELGIKHLGNTVVPYTPDTKNDMYTLFGDAVKKIMLSELNKQTALLIDGLNGAWEAIGQ